MKLTHQQLFDLLEEKAAFYNNPEFIEKDPKSIPHLFKRKEDIEIAGFLAATLAWGQRVTIINKSRELMNRMENAPFDFVMNASKTAIGRLSSFVHRTFQGEDCMYFMLAIQQIYRLHGGLEAAFLYGYQAKSISQFRKMFFVFEHLHRTIKHMIDHQNGSAAKRANIYIKVKWMINMDINM